MKWAAPKMIARQAILWAIVAVLALQALVHAQFSYTTNSDNTITITGYTGTGGVVNIVGTINGLSVVAIIKGAFDTDCRINRIALPASVTNIGDLGFSVGRNVTTFDVDFANNVYSSVDGVLFDKGRFSLVQFPGGKKVDSYSVPINVTRIGHTAFDSCTNLTSVTIPSSVTNIGVAAFWRCASLTNITIPAGVTSVGSSAFLCCTNLTSVTIPNSVTCIEDRTFFLCRNLASLTIPKSVASIGHWAFYGCTSLTGVYFKGNAPNLSGHDWFAEAEKATIYYLPGTTGWSNTFAGRPTAIWNTQTNGVAQGKNLFKQQSYAAALTVLGSVIDDDTAPSEIQAEALYWKAETLFAQGDLTNAYKTAKHLVWDYPSTKWAGRYMHHLPEPKEKHATQSPPPD